MTESTANILHLQRLSTEDGPGIRTTIFFKGCSLGCQWCHNPESIASKVQLQWFAARCLGCRTCLKVCPQGAVTLTQAGMVIDRERCDGCGNCAEACPANALEALGHSVSSSALLKEVLKDRAYYEASEGHLRGGVTASGGEPALQAKFIAELFTALQAQGIHTALDTCGVVASEVLESLVPMTDLFLFDLKLMDSDQHRFFTGQGNERILQNFQRLIEGLRAYPQKRLWIRTPLIPGATANTVNLEAIGKFLSGNGAEQVERWELCAFNNLCRDKYSRLGMEWLFAQTPLMTMEELTAMERAAQNYFRYPERVSATGTVQTVRMEG